MQREGRVKEGRVASHHCIVQCRELRPYPEELDNNCFNLHLHC